MRLFITAITALLLAGCQCGLQVAERSSNQNVLETIQDNWILLDSAAASETGLAHNTSKWATVLANASVTGFDGSSLDTNKIPTYWNAVVLRFRGNDAAASGVAAIYGAVEGNDFSLLGTVTLTAATGDAKAATAGGYYFETASVTAVWGGLIIEDNSAGDGIATILFDRKWLSRIVVLFTTVSASDTLYCDWNGY